MRMGDVPSAGQYSRRALEYHRRGGERWAEAVNLHKLGVKAITLAEPEQAEQLLTAALDLRRDMGDARGEMSTLWSLARLAVNQGDVDLADQHTQEMERLALSVDDQYLFGQAQESAAHIDMVRSDWPAALDHSSRAQSIYESQGRTRKVQRERIRQAAILGFSGNTKNVSVVEEVLEWALSENQSGTQLHAYEALTVLSLLDKNYQMAAQHIDAAVALSNEMNLTSASGRLSARQGLVRLLLLDESGAKASLGRAALYNSAHQETVLLDGLVKVADGDSLLAAERIAEAKRIAGANWHITQRLFQALDSGI